MPWWQSIALQQLLQPSAYGDAELVAGRGLGPLVTWERTALLAWQSQLLSPEVCCSLKG